MPCVFPLAATLLGALAGMGCNSPLTEYRCTTTTDCGEEGARCEASGHCSFTDGECDSGFSFDSSAGSESGLCVANEVSESGPVARIDELDLACGQTSASFSGARSEASEGATLTKFDWKIRDAEGTEIATLGGPPDAEIVRGLHRLGGKYSEPTLNLTTYQGQRAIRVSDEDSDFGPTLYRDITSALGAFGGDSTDFVLSFALGKLIAPTGDVLAQVEILAEDVAVQTLPIIIGQGFQPYRLQFPSISKGMIGPPVMLKFRFERPGNYWVDNIALIDESSSNRLVAEGSVEEGTQGWLVSPSVAQGGEVSTGAIPDGMMQSGDYTIVLRVTDSLDRESESDILDLTVADCP